MNAVNGWRRLHFHPLSADGRWGAVEEEDDADVTERERGGRERERDSRRREGRARERRGRERERERAI